MTKRGTTWISYMLSVFVLLTMTGSFCIYSCTEEKEPRLSNAMMGQVDTIFMNLTDSLGKSNDSLCDHYYPLYYESAVDSIRQLRLKEIQSIIGK